MIDRHKQILAAVDGLVKQAEQVQNEIRLTASRLVKMNTLKQMILSDCTPEREVSIKNADIQKLMQELYKYSMASSAFEACRQYQRDMRGRIERDIELLNPGLAGLLWLFGGKNGKEQAAQAYHELQELLGEECCGRMLQNASNADVALRTTADTAWNAYELDAASFSETLRKVYSDILCADATNPPFQTLLSSFDRLEQKISVGSQTTDGEKETIRKAAERLIAYTALQILQNVPVEEVNRERSGFRVKTLHDAGMDTMADIYAASSYQLASLYGVSENAAFSMKRIATQMLADAQKGTKIRLSADDRNKASTELVRALYSYRLKKANRTEFEMLLSANKPAWDTSAKALASVRNGMPWLFYTPAKRQELREAYEALRKGVESEEARRLEVLGELLHNAKSKAVSDETVWDDFKQNNIEYISILEEIVPEAVGNDDVLYGLPEELAREIQDEVVFPDGLLCTLRRYQEWGVKYILHQKRTLLGDEMGLGKTVQAIAAMVSLRNTGATHFMVICPASVVTNWCREVTKHSRLRVTKIHGSGRGSALRSWMKTGGVAVTTYETTVYIKDENVEKLDFLVVDEAHYIKNPEARRSINVKRLCAKTERLLFMTGTALENRVDEMVALIDVLRPDIASTVEGMTFMSNAPQFRNRIAPVYYRRKRENVLKELPELIVSKEWCTLEPGEKEIYEESVLNKSFSAARRLSWNAEDMKHSCKAKRLLEIIEEAESEDRKVLVFSFFLDTIRVIGQLLGARCYGPINGSVPVAQRQEIIDSFDKAPAGSVLLAQIQSGGTGLNIQSASVVVICEPQFKPSVENQAISRAYRMGQARNVLVYRLLCTNTIDEKLTELLESKQEIFDAFADRSVAAENTEVEPAEVDEKKFGQLIQEEIDRIVAEKEKREGSGTKAVSQATATAETLGAAAMPAQ